MADHPERLLWYVSGRLDPDDVGLVEAHLPACAECRSTVATLQAWGTTILSPSGPEGHPAPETLDALAGGAPPLPETERRQVENHLSGCAPCRDDLEALRRTYERSPIASPREARGRRWWLAACAAAVLAAPAGWWLLARREPPIVLMPTARSAESAPVLAGSGPWPLQVVKPSTLAAGRYRMWIERADGKLVLPLPDLDLIDEEPKFRLVVPAIPDPGPYRLMIAPSTGGSDAAHSYPFEVVAPNND